MCHYLEKNFKYRASKHPSLFKKLHNKLSRRRPKSVQTRFFEADNNLFSVCGLRCHGINFFENLICYTFQAPSIWVRGNENDNFTKQCLL